MLMTNFRVIGAMLAMVASVGCATPNKYTPPDADEGIEGSPDGSATPDTAKTAADAPLAFDGPGGDQASLTDTGPPPPDGPCGTATDPRNCGTCGHDCTKLPNVVASAVTCQASKCVVPTTACTGGYAHCSANVEDGCEANLARQETCGGCGTKCGAAELCAVAGGSYQCASSCAGATPDKCTGTCTNLQTDSHNCGSCGHDCGQLANVKSGGAVSCQGGHCMIPASSCNAGFGHCGSAPADNGCETNISVPQTCGCSSCASGQVCASNGSSYQCTCGGGTMKCGNACVDLANDALNCGTCGHSCLGGTCVNNVCQVVNIYTGTDIIPQTLTADSNFLYFKRTKSSGVNVLARMPKGGGQTLDLTSVDEGEDNVALANGLLYWAKGDIIKGCAAPSCTSPFTIPNQMSASNLTANAEHTRLFWARVGPGPATGDVMTNPSGPTIQGTISNGPIFLSMVALGNYAFVHADNTIYRVSGTVPEITPVGDGVWGLAVNAQSIFFLEDPNGTGPIILKKYSVAATGSPQTASEVGSYTFYDGKFGLLADSSYAYLLIGSTTENALRLLRCAVGGCGNAPAELAYVRVGTLERNNSYNWLMMDSEAIYWGSPSGVFRIAR
jgi:hypothetical protein